MNLDISPELWVTVIAGMVGVAGAVVVGLWRATQAGDALRARLVAAAVIIGWLVVDVVAALAGAFEASPDRRVPTIAVGLVVPLAAGIWLLVRPGPVRDVVERLPVPWLIGVQVYRVVGVVFVLAWAQGSMPAAFALPAGLGDVAIGLAAPLVACRVARRPAPSRGIAVLWNLAGIADLVIAVTLGFLTSPSPFQQLSLADPNYAITRLPFVLVPAFAVPLSVLLHVASLRRLRRAVAEPATVTPGARRSPTTPATAALRVGPRRPSTSG